MGLNIPDDLDLWKQRQRQQGGVVARMRARRGADEAPTPLRLHVKGERPEVLTVLDSTSPTQMKSLIEPVVRLENRDIAVLAPGAVPGLDERDGWTSVDIDPGLDDARLESVRAVLSAGHYLPRGAAAWEWAGRRGVPYVVVQHGLMTPQAPPLPHDVRLLAFSEQDAKFWASGRTDVTWDVVGSQLLWDAAASAGTGRAPVDPTAPPVYLGQLHGGELPRWGKVRRATAFCRAQHAVYRPHPNEKDKLSRVTHAAWESMGITVERNGGPLTEVRAPVVAAFSTGVLEAAARGIPAWVHYPDPPDWLEEFWDRYRLHRWGQDPTPAPPQPPVEPAQAIAARLTDLIKDPA